MNDLMREQLLLELRNAIVDKEWVIACANMETARGGWTCDWNEGILAESKKIEALINNLNGK
jgi:hypothetical protein